MVGAGFSRNADAISSTAPPFPLWGHFTERLRKDLYGDPKAEGTPDVLRLAEEYELAAGRTALDDLLLELIPDAQYQPGPLHDLLLSLPWADIFTTNYDTLLERARLKVHEFKYDLVQTPSDIARAERPRIIKLHGSFPSHRPFIFTAEDYRTYPTRFAPFVNMVQQAIMENVFCMIGFSGNDPNFLQWTGWVRDHLGTSAPKIYLCDVLDLTPAKERLYQSLRVIPVDLGPLVPATRWTTSMRYRKALEWLLLSLWNGRPLDMSKWPTPPKPVASSYREYAEPPALLKPPEMPRLVPPPSPPPLGHKLTQDALRQLVESWRSERLAYPGWIVTPEFNRQKLYSETDEWLDQQLSITLGELPLTEQAETLYEFLWRVRRALVPLTPWLAKDLSRLLERLNPKPELIDLQGVASKPETPQGGNADKLTEIWVEFAFALLNDAWQDQIEDQYALWLKRLEQVVKLHPLWLARWYYAQCWHHLLRLDEKSVRAVLKRWPENWGLPFWEAKRASVLAELGDAEAALRHADTALERVRQGMSSASADLVIRSEEGWLIELVRMIELAKKWPSMDHHEDPQARFRHRPSSQCDPREDLRLRERALQQAPAKARESKTYDFDPGSESTTYHFSAGDSMDEWILVQSLHDGACPVRCGYVVFAAPKSMAEAIRRLWQHRPRLALALALRARSLDELKKLLGRVDVSTMDPATARSIYEWLSRAFLDAMETHSPVLVNDGDVEGLRWQLLNGCPLILSRLTLHLTPEQLAQTFNIAMKMYRYEPFQHHPSNQELVGQMFKRVLFAASIDQVYAWLPRLLGLPLKAELFSGKSEPSRWTEPLGSIPWQADWRRPTESERASWAEPVQRLIRILQEGTPELRADASVRVAILSQMGGIADEHRRSFVDALWSQNDGNGLPSHVGFIPSFLVALQDERSPGENRTAVTRYLLTLEPTNITDYLNEFANGMVYPWHTDEERRTRIEWSPSEAETLLRKVLDWWARKPPNFTRRIVPRLTRHLCIVIIPHLGERAEAHKESVFKLVSDIEGLGDSTILAQPALMILDPSRDANTARLIQRAIHGARKSVVKHGLVALIDWFGLARTRGVPPPPLYLLDEWVEGFVARRQPGLLDALLLLVLFVRRFGDQLQEHHLQKLHEGLEFLLRETHPTGAGGTDDELPLIAEERIALREHASHLAARLAAEHQRRGSGIPPVLDEWRKVGSTDPLPEVRQAWAPTSEPKLE
ncbi:hypothetical protein BO221_15730 [Archangium sp. Cb G35]|nr:hypothetical protein BO221_15730 [Archangium sp. Cb G35]